MAFRASFQGEQTRMLSRRTLFKVGGGGLVGLMVPCLRSRNDAAAHSSVEAAWTMRAAVKDWLITPASLATHGDEIYVAGNLDDRIAVIDHDGKIGRYYRVEKELEFDNVCVDVTSQGRVLAASSKGLWELKPSGEVEQLARLDFLIDCMKIGPDDNVYVSRKSGWRSRILKLGLDGPTRTVVAVPSNRISDLEFGSSGQMMIADAERGRILTYTEEQGLQSFMTGFADPSGGGPFYLAFDDQGRLYSASAQHGLALISQRGDVESLQFHATGDLSFARGKLYTLDIYSSTLYRLEVGGGQVTNKQVFLAGDTPRYIDANGDVVVGERTGLSGRQYYNYYLTDPVQIEPNQLLNSLEQPRQFAFDDAGNVYVLYGGNMLQKVTASGSAEILQRLPGEFRWDTRLHYSPYDDKLYYFDVGSNSVMRAGRTRTESYHTFSQRPERVFLAPHPGGGVYAGTIRSGHGRLFDLSDPARERVIWEPPQRNVFWMLIDSDQRGNLYAALGPVFQQVYAIDPTSGTATSIVPDSTARYEMGFVDPQGFTVLESGEVVLAAPGLLVVFDRS